VPIADIAALTGVRLDQLALVDRLGAPVTGVAPPPGQVSTGWKELGSLEDVVLTN
jgi:endonuclease G, mitochondrial